jgi:hypothetical protein
MEVLTMLLLLPPAVALAAVYNGWKFRYFDRERYLLKYQNAARRPFETDAGSAGGLQ